MGQPGPVLSCEFVDRVFQRLKGSKAIHEVTRNNTNFFLQVRPVFLGSIFHTDLDLSLETRFAPRVL
jgi:hypothetical protein